jgi:voltage-gated potassium channel
VVEATPKRQQRALRWYERLTVWRAVQTIMILVLIFSLCAALAARLVEPETFTSFGDALWWSVTTVSTTGYGDVVPVTTPGRIVGGLTMLVGMAFVPLLTSVVVSILLQRMQQRGAGGPFVSVIEKAEKADQGGDSSS